MSNKMIDTSYSETAKKLEQFGMVGVSGGIQVDINAARRKLSDGIYQDAAFCDHNCRIETNGTSSGHYECPAAFTRNKGIDPRTLASSDLLLKGIDTTADGLRAFNKEFLIDGGFNSYAKRYQVNGMVRNVLADVLSSDRIEVNCFGGNPELHPALLELMKGLRGYKVNLTTTGGIFMRSGAFVEQFMEAPPNLIALSADDFASAPAIQALNQLSLDKIQARRDKIHPIFGQQRKALEAIYVAKLAQLHKNFPQVLFNLVVHAGNIDSIEEIIGTLRTEFPGVIVNPYPAQSSFENKPAIFKQKHLHSLETFIDTRIAEHIGKKTGIVPRLHYWVMLKAVFATYRRNSNRIIQMLSGYDVWRCYKQPGAGRYVQIGASPAVHKGGKIAGGHLNCFWNSTTIAQDNDQVWNDSFHPQDVVSYLSEGAKKIAGTVGSPCSGCLMPRLAFDMVSTELGMHKSLIPNYLALRKQTAGF